MIGGGWFVVADPHDGAGSYSVAQKLTHVWEQILPRTTRPGEGRRPRHPLPGRQKPGPSHRRCGIRPFGTQDSTTLQYTAALEGAVGSGCPFVHRCTCRGPWWRAFRVPAMPATLPVRDARAGDLVAGLCVCTAGRSGPPDPDMPFTPGNASTQPSNVTRIMQHNNRE